MTEVSQVCGAMAAFAVFILICIIINGTNKNSSSGLCTAGGKVNHNILKSDHSIKHGQNQKNRFNTQPESYDDLPPQEDTNLFLWNASDEETKQFLQGTADTEKVKKSVTQSHNKFNFMENPTVNFSRNGAVNPLLSLRNSNSTSSKTSFTKETSMGFNTSEAYHNAKNI